MPAFIDITGIRFGRLVVKDLSHTDHRGSHWTAVCDCGNIVTKSSSYLRSGHTKSCGCLHRDTCIERNKKHGYGAREGRGKIYRAWKAMRQRCNDKNASNYSYYGGRGIRVCAEWGDYPAFHKWAEASGHRDDLTLDRIDVNGDYAPDNCRWSDKLTQTRNRRTTNLHLVNGELMTASEISRKYGLVYTTLVVRLRKGASAQELVNRKEIP